MSSFLLRRAGAAAPARCFSTTPARGLARMSIIGNLTDAPEVAETKNGRGFVKYTIASNSGPKDKRTTSFFRVTSFSEGPRRDFLLGIPKGALVFVEAEGVISNYKDNTGQSRSTLNITQRSLELLKRPAEAEGEYESR